MEGVLISIVIANYNYGRFLEDAITSVITQEGFDRCELILVDGGSTDNSLDVIQKYSDKIAWWVSEPDKGQSDAFNKGFNRAKGKFFTWLNADDILMRDALKAIIGEIAQYPTCEWFTGSTVWTDKDLNVVRCFCAHRFSWLRAKFGFLSVNGPSSFFSRRLYESVGGFDESLHYVMDTDLWYKFARLCGATYRRTRHNVWAYRKHEASKMSGADEYVSDIALNNRQKSKLESQTIIRRYGLHRGLFYKIVMAVTISPIDAIISSIRNKKWKGHSACSIK